MSVFISIEVDVVTAVEGLFMLKSSVVRSRQICIQMYIHRWDAAERPRGSAVKLFIYESDYNVHTQCHKSLYGQLTVVYCIWNMQLLTSNHSYI